MTAADALKSLTDPANGNATGARGTITALREDGNVNVRLGGPNGVMLPGIPCSAQYVGRAIGDTVQLVQFNNTWIVMAAIGPDSETKTPTVKAQAKYQYNLMNNQITDTQPTTLWVGQDTTHTNTLPMSVVAGYWTGSKNLLTTTSVGHSLSPIYLRVARSTDTVGTNGPITVQVLPHNSDALPTTSIVPVNGFSTLLVNLEVGEQKDVQLPADWVAGITAGSPTIRGFMFIPGQFKEASSPQDQTYVILSPSTGGITLGQWTPWAPVWSCSSGANPSIGNGSIVGRYSVDANKTVTGVGQITCGSTTTFGGGPHQLTYPVPPRIGSPDMVCQLRISGLPGPLALVGQGVVSDNVHMNLQCQTSATNGALQTINNTATPTVIPTGGLSASTIIRVNFIYEAA